MKKSIDGGARERFAKFVADPQKPQRLICVRAVLDVVGVTRISKTWETLHQLGQQTASIEEKVNIYRAMAGALRAGLANRSTLPRTPATKCRRPRPGTRFDRGPGG